HSRGSDCYSYPSRPGSVLLRMLAVDGTGHVSWNLRSGRSWRRSMAPYARVGRWLREARNLAGMRLSSKIFLASALVIVVLAGVSALSLGAVGGLVSVNREITTRTIPALSLAASVRDAIQ